MGLLFRASTAVDSRIIDSIMLAAASEQRWHVIDALEGFNDWGGRGYDNFVPVEVIKTAPSGDETT